MMIIVFANVSKAIPMKKFLGLSIVRKPLTDAEFVERARKDIQRWQRFGKWLVLFHLALLMLWGFFLSYIIYVLINLGVNQFQIIGGLFIGIALGISFGLPILHSLHQFSDCIRMLKGDRTSLLLVKYHDMLVDLARSEENSTSPEQAGQGGGMIRVSNP